MSRPFMTPSIFTAETPLPTQLFRRPSKNEKDRVKRARASKPKVKSGCITCKARRVKCDETKPECLRCQRFGRKCDGYTPEPTPRSTAVVPIQPRLQPPPTVSTLTLTVHESEEERQYFDFFRDHTAHELAGYNDPTFWTDLVVQEAYALAPIRYAVVAIGALNKSLSSASMCEGKVTDLQTADQTHYQFAVSHYIKAIQALNQHISGSKGPQLRTALIACILFSCFETFEGGYQTSQQQVNEGVKLLRSYYAGTPGSKSRAFVTPTTRDPIQNGNGYAAHEGNRRISGVTIQFEDYLRLDNGPRQVLEEMVGFPSPGKDPATMMFEAQRDSTPTAHNQHIENFGEPLHHLTRSSSVQLDLQSTQQRNSNEYTSGESSSEPLHINRARISEDICLNLYHTKNPGYVPQEPRHSSWVPQPEEARISTADTFSPPLTRIHTPNPPPQSHQKLLTPLAPPILHNDVPIEDILIQTLVRLDGRCFLSGVMYHSLPFAWDIHKIYHLPVPKYFPSFNAAHRCWVFLADRIHHFCRRTLFNRSHTPQACDPPSMIMNIYASLMKSLAEFGTALHPILDTAIEPNGNIVNPAVLVLSMHHKVTLVVLSAVTCESEMIYDSFLSTFQDIVRTASLINSGYNTSSLPRNPKFSFDMGVAPPLYVVATKCRDSVLRREALDLLSMNPTFEGGWDSILIARVGHWLMDIEEGLRFERLEIFGADSKLPASVKEHPHISGAGFPDINIQEPAEPVFSYPSPPQLNNYAIFKTGSPFYDNLNGAEIHEQSTAGRYDPRHRDTNHSLSMSDENKRRRSEANMNNTRSAYPSTRSRHHSSAGEITSDALLSSIDPIFTSSSAPIRLKHHSTSITKNGKRRESGVASQSPLAVISSASLTPDSIIARHNGTSGIIPGENENITRRASSTNFTDINYDKAPTAIPQHASNPLNGISSYENSSNIDPLSQPSPTNWPFPSAAEESRSSTSTPRPTKKPRHPMRTEQEETNTPCVIPESARVRVTVFDWHVPERYLRVECERVVPGLDGMREVRETILSW